MLRWIPVVLLVACDAEPPEPVGPEGRLVIEELYYAGSPPAGGADHYFSDQFIELANNSTDRVQLEGVMIADVYGAAGAINPGMQPDSYGPDGRVVLESVWRIPDEAVLEPGQTVIIAHDGTNHAPFSTVDLSGANWETYVEDSGGDDDYPTVANLESEAFNGGYDWLITVFGPSVVVLSEDAELDDVDDGPWPLLEVSPDAVIDCVDAVMDGDSGDFKRLPEDLDAGFTHVSDAYTGESVRRVRTGADPLEGGWLQDSDDSSEDFEVLDAPEPRG